MGTKNIAILGASGLLGAHLIEQGLIKGHKIRAIARSIPSRSGIHQLKDKIEIIQKDILTLSASDFEGIDTIINTAAIVSVDQNQSVIDDNLKLVHHILSLIKADQSKKFVHISSIATMSNGHDNKTINENDHGNFRSTKYAEAKFECDKMIDAHSKKNLIIHPCYMLGKWDSKPTSGAIILAAQLKRLPGYTNHQKNFVHAKDVANGIYTALEKNTQGHYILGGENISLKNFMERLFQKLQLKERPVELDEHFLEAHPHFKDFFLTNAVDDSRARNDWGYTSPTHLDTMLDETITYLRENRLLPRLKSL